MVEVAEVAGTLDETLKVIAHERSRGELLRRRITSAMTYPAFLAFAATGVLIFVLMGIIPEFERALAGLQSQGEGSTEMVFALSRSLRANADLFGLIGVLAMVGVLLIVRSRSAKALFMRLIGRVPGIRQVVRFEQAVSFCATLGTLSRSGVGYFHILASDPRSDARCALRAKIDQLVSSVRQGHRLSEGLLEHDILPIYAVHMLRVGEESGELDSAAIRIAGFYEEKLDRSLTRLTGILGPAIMILVSLLIAWLIVSVITALLSVNDLLL
jgi:general secretion pathway protein F